MNELAAAPTTTPSSAKAEDGPRAGVWRALSLLAVVIAVLVAAISVLDSRRASDVEALDAPALALETTLVTIADDLSLPAGAEIAVLGLDAETNRKAILGDSTGISVPQGMAATIALFDASNSIVGLSLLSLDDNRAAVEISATSTARALLALSPGILRANLVETIATLDVIETDEAFARLVTAIAANPDLSEPDEAAETAFAEIADRVPIKVAPPDQGCDSVLDRQAFAVAGTCVQPLPTGVLVENEQDRWALLLGTPGGWDNLCGVVAPARTDGSELTVGADSCGSDVLLAAPGPLVELGIEPAIIERVRSAMAVNLLYSYAGPFADLAAGSAGFQSQSVLHIQDNIAAVVVALDGLAATEPAFAAAVRIAEQASTPGERHRSAIDATRALIAAADVAPLIPQRVPGNDDYLALLDFYQRAGDRMVATRTDWRWTADAFGEFAIEAGS